MPVEGLELDKEATAENIARHISTSAKSGRIHEPTYNAAKAGALMALECSQAEAIIAALQSDVTGSASVIDHLTQRAERAEADNAVKDGAIKMLQADNTSLILQEKALHADNAALTARVKELEAENAALEKQALRDRSLANETHSDATLWQFSVDMGDHPSLLVKVWRQRKALETQLAAARKALEPFAEAADGRKSKSVTGSVCFTQHYLLSARAALEAKP